MSRAIAGRPRVSPSVRWLQESLNRALGLRLAVDGVMGPQTWSALRSFQQRRGLKVDGIVGPKTLRALVQSQSITSRSGSRNILTKQPRHFPATPVVVPRVLKYSTTDVIDKRISVPAQHALVRLSKDPASREDAVRLLGEIKAGRLAGIYCVNWKVPASRARSLGSFWWRAIPVGEDAVLMLDPRNPWQGRPLIAFRRRLDPACGLLPREGRFARSPERLDRALRKALSTYDLWRTSRPSQCLLPEFEKPLQTEAFLPARLLRPVAAHQRRRLGRPGDAEEDSRNILPPLLCSTEPDYSDYCEVPPQGCQTPFEDAGRSLKKNNWKMHDWNFNTIAFRGIEVFSTDKKTGFQRLAASVAPNVPAMGGYGKLLFLETNNRNIPQLWAVFVPRGLNFGAPIPIHVFFSPKPTAKQIFSPYPYGKEWNNHADKYLVNKRRRLLQQHIAAGKTCLFIFPFARPGTVFGNLSDARELRRTLLEILCRLGACIPQTPTSPSLGYCAVSGFSYAGDVIRMIMLTSLRNEFPELAEIYCLDTPVVGRKIPQSWLNSVSRFGQRRMRIYTSDPNIAQNRPADFSGSPTRSNLTAKEWQTTNGTFVYTPEQFWKTVFHEHDVHKNSQADYDRDSAHEFVPCVFLEHALKNSGFP